MVGSYGHCKANTRCEVARRVVCEIPLISTNGRKETVSRINVLVVGTGEYTTGYVRGAGSAADKRAGVVGITLFGLRRRGVVDRLTMVGTNGTKFPEIREYLDRTIGRVYREMDLAIAALKISFSLQLPFVTLDLAASFSARLATAQEALWVTAILEAGRRSLDNHGQCIAIEIDERGSVRSLRQVH